MRASPRAYGGTVAAQAAQLEQALLAAGRDVDDPHIWDIWQQRGLKAALNELENKHMIEVRYSPARFASVPHLKLGAPPQEAQTVWQQLDRTTAPADNAGQAYIQRNYNAAAALGDRPSIDEIRRKQGMW
jgi:hypothetical protein